MRWESSTFAVGDVRLHVRRVVDPPAPPVVLLHGLGVSGSVLQPFARRLLPELAAVVPDLRGHGLSDKPAGGYRPEDYAADIASLIENALKPPVPVIGHSLGSLIGLELARVRADLVRWLVLLDPPLDPVLRNPEVGFVSQLRHAPPGDLENYLLERNPGGGEFLAQTLAREFRQAVDAPFEAMLSGPLYTPRRVQVSTLVVQADPEHGGVLGDDAAARAVAILGNARLEKIAGASHAVHATNAAEVADAIRRFYFSDSVSSR
jgi:pimeloyl-ACP methyl ester carboxylesterase